jgi:hypothetical protein
VLVDNNYLKLKNMIFNLKKMKDQWSSGEQTFSDGDFYGQKNDSISFGSVEFGRTNIVPW